MHGGAKGASMLVKTPDDFGMALLDPVSQVVEVVTGLVADIEVQLRPLEVGNHRRMAAIVSSTLSAFLPSGSCR
jgi:hypothetical protein